MIVLSDNQYGKAETHLVRVYRDADRHELRDLTVSTALRGEFADAHISGDQRNVLPTDSQKNAVFAYAKDPGIATIERYTLALARHFVDDIAPVSAARVGVDEHVWQRVGDHPYAWVRSGGDMRTAEVTVDGSNAWVIAGLRDLVLLKSSGSEFAGFLHDRYTTLAETHDRIMATSLVARWRYAGIDHDFDALHCAVRKVLIEQFADLHSRALQHSLWHMAQAVLEEHAEIVEIRLSAPNMHHIAVDLEPFGLTNDNDVFHATDRPYGLIQCTAARDDAPDAGPAWEPLTA